MQHGVDQPEVGERLGVVAEVAPALGVEFLGVQAQRRSMAQEPLAQRRGALGLTDLRQR